MANTLKKISGGVTAAAGFRAASTQAGIKIAAPPRLDLSLLCSDRATETAATFTTNRVKAAPVRVCASNLRGGDVRAVVINSGNANACTGPQGILDAKAMCSTVAKDLDLRMRQVLVCSTGIIGVPLPMEKILAGIPQLEPGLSSKGGAEAARAIMTSDTGPKEVAYKVKIPDVGTVTIGGMAKGAGMINPNMATMLAFITTDAKLSSATVRRFTDEAVERSFNRITVDGDTSTNDTVIVMANGASGTRTISPRSAAGKAFQSALTRVMKELATMIVRDGERVTKFVTIAVKGAATHRDARLVAEAVANSSLVKCSWNGGDPNWGRVIHAVGYAGAPIREELVDIYFEGLAATKGGLATSTPLKRLEAVVEKPEFQVTIDLNLGKADYTVYTSDLSPEYVEFNRAEYALAQRQRAAETSSSS